MITQLIFYLLILIPNTIGELCVSHAMKGIGEVHDFHPRAIAKVILQALTVPRVWIGAFMIAIGFFALLGMLSVGAVSFVFPATALSYALATLGGKIFLNEQVSMQRWIGVLIVCMGVLLVFIGKN